LLCKLDLSEELNKMLIATVRIENDDLFHAIAGDLTADVIQQTQDELRVNGDGALAMARFENLCEYNVGENNRGFDRCCPAAELAINKHVRPDG
jgi:hypothetical protein